ncbi:uncharacterized protein LOC126590625 [Malus sylvestris]|uniref:uncharacterized protein LOC126590625 n=1 Tax=Malus sylvestris TaxID=3752 RepID=UPI0021AC0662|nr:uncharacterized protein LOC126590625 [Malus sylvestris]
MTQLGYEKSHCEFSFGTEQRHVTLSMAAILLPFPLWCKDLILRSYQKMAWMLSYQGREQLGAPLQLCHPHPQSQLLHGDVKGHVILHMKLNITTQLRVMSPSSFCLPKCANIGRRKSGEITTRWLHLECILQTSVKLQALSMDEIFVSKTLQYASLDFLFLCLNNISSCLFSVIYLFVFIISICKFIIDC